MVRVLQCGKAHFLMPYKHNVKDLWYFICKLYLAGQVQSYSGLGNIYFLSHYRNV